MSRIPVPGAFYRHFKNKLYQVVAVATHSETGEQMVVYQALYGDYKVYVRPLDMFMSPVDRKKYPDAAQKYRFEQVYPGTSMDLFSGAEEGLREEQPGQQREEQADAPLESWWLEAFLDADSTDQQLAVLKTMEGRVSRRELDCICVALDLKPEPEEKSALEQIEDIRQFLLLRKKYDGSHLR